MLQTAYRAPIAALLTLALSLAPALRVPHTAQAEETKMSVTGTDAIKAALQKLTGKSVTVRIGEEESITGIVEEVGPDTVRIGQLSGKEFFSALVSLRSVTAVIYRAK